MDMSAWLWFFVLLAMALAIVALVLACTLNKQDNTKLIEIGMTPPLESKMIQSRAVQVTPVNMRVVTPVNMEFPNGPTIELSYEILGVRLDANTMRRQVVVEGTGLTGNCRVMPRPNNSDPSVSSFTFEFDLHESLAGNDTTSIRQIIGLAWTQGLVPGRFTQLSTTVAATPGFITWQITYAFQSPFITQDIISCDFRIVYDWEGPNP